MQQAHMQPQNEPQAETKKNCLTDLTLPAALRKVGDYASASQLSAPSRFLSGSTKSRLRIFLP